jgi:hypothetical protein
MVMYYYLDISTLNKREITVVRILLTYVDDIFSKGKMDISQLSTTYDRT